MRGLIRIGTVALMEVLGSVPCRSETQYLEGIRRGAAEWKQANTADSSQSTAVSLGFPFFKLVAHFADGSVSRM